MSADDVQKAVALIEGLTLSRDDRHKQLPFGTEGMPVEELKQCAGLAFTFTKKGGLVLSVEVGHGFVIAKLDAKETAGHRWSAPLFFDVYGSSVGVTLGVSIVDSVIILDTKEAVDSFKRKSQASLDSDINISLGDKVGINQPSTALDIVHPKLTNKTFTYSMSKGLMLLDTSLKGIGFRVDAKANEAAYNKTSWTEILEGYAQQPAEFKPLYDAIAAAMNP